MSTMPVQPVPPIKSITTQADLSAALLAQVNASMTHHARLAYVALAIVLLVVTVGGYFGYRSYDKALSQAQAAQTLYQAQQKTLTDLLQADAVERAQNAQAQASLVAQITKRDAQAPPPAVSKGLAPTATADDAKNALQASYSDTPAFGTLAPTEGPNVVLSVPQAQQAIQTKLNADRSGADLKDTETLFSLEKTNNLLLTKDLDQCKVTLGDANKDIAAWRKAAVKSRWQKFMSGIEKVGLFAAGMEIGHHL